MFERYTEKARRAVFFARYEASQFGSPEIDTEHLLLGLLRETRALRLKLESSGTSAYKLRAKVESRTTLGEKLPTSVDLPVSNASKRVLVYAADEAERLADQQIGSEHLVLGLLREGEGLAAQLLKEAGLSLNSLREEISSWRVDSGTSATTIPNLPWDPNLPSVEVHGRRLLIAWVKRSAQRLKQFAWVRRVWKPLDVVADSKEGGISFDLSVEDGQRYRVVAGGWTKEPCAICGWELSAEGGPERSETFTNGREWLCLECYHKFVAKEGAEVA
jgi:hypothetical protein